MFTEDEIFSNSIHIPKFIRKIAIKFFQINSIIIIKENIIILPYYKKTINNITSKKLNKYFKKINKLLKKENIKTIALSNYLNSIENIETFKNNFYSENYNILNGRWLFKHLSFEVLEYISRQIKKPLNELEISILTNTTNDFTKENIKLLSQNIKNLNIVTSNINYFKPLTQELYNSFGISIRISNNKKKILLKSDIILNFDFPEEIINKFSLPLNGIIVNYSNKIKVFNKLFNGLNINYYSINIDKALINIFKEVNLLDAFNLEILYESLYFKETSFQKMLTHFINDNLSIASLVGNLETGTVLFSNLLESKTVPIVTT